MFDEMRNVFFFATYTTYSVGFADEKIFWQLNIPE